MFSLIRFHTDFHVKSCLLTEPKTSVLPYESTTGLSIWHLRSDLIILHKIDIQFYLYIIDSFKAVKWKFQFSSTSLLLFLLVFISFTAALYFSASWKDTIYLKKLKISHSIFLNQPMLCSAKVKLVHFVSKSEKMWQQHPKNKSIKLTKYMTFGFYRKKLFLSISFSELLSAF